MQYHKIHSIYKRNPATNYKTFLHGEFSRPEFELIKEWFVEEKINGTNVRVSFDGVSVTFAGRTDKAQLPLPLFRYLQETFTLDRMAATFSNTPDNEPHPNIILYGEGYGAKIQKGGGNYIPDGVGFCLFDVRVGRWWLARDSVWEIALGLEIPRAPYWGIWDLQWAEKQVREGIPSILAKVPGTIAEGVVLRPPYELFDRRGDRIIAKLKTRDYE